ncbi:hypothetical protein HJC10_04080 [Corallococcus exiguus]|uniref:hypothetical protein n=1 Tax=Corallococcus TaxID=83461 RepID=UPI000EC80325|nr:MULTISPECIES: hypothetical protein [Corallococcus]NNB85151.1 hypothetical protein [Corallococcus exiguus]NNB93346.1 hypothetical protein [Corallococcus exiguus]NNC02030.1 hypothetical protein [Corallococcus exiguus]NPC47347.1 hypothetical protein [Corallococcus exiguus]RKH84197.1 hypothetical protein D7X99_10535 [Corallococcus sp. AB032C]
MHIESPRSARSPKAVTFLRIPVLLAVGMMTMGSGMGNPGCGGSNYSVCESGCAIGGTYTLQFADTSPPGEVCETLGLGLPTGPLELTRSGRTVSAGLDGMKLSGDYDFDEADRPLTLYGTKSVTSTRTYSGSIKSAVATPAPETETDTSVITGEYELIGTSEDNSLRCHIKRNFTATR